MTKIYTKGSTAVDEVLASTERYDIKEDAGTAFKTSMQVVLSTPVVTAGTNIDAARINNMEDGIDAIDTRVDNLDTKLADVTDLLTTGGTSTAYTLTTTGAASLVTGERYRVKFNATAGATPTLNRDGVGAKSLKYYDSAAVKTACGATNIILNMISDVVYDGTDYIVVSPVGVSATVTDATISMSDITTNNSSTSKHGFLKKLSAVATEYMNGVGNWVVITAASLFATPESGWVEVSETWTYASAKTITIPTDGTLKYQKSMKIRLKQGGAYKYFVAYSVTATLITIIESTDYTLVSGAITDIAYSFIEQPYDWTDWYNYAPTPTGFSAVPTNVVYRWKANGTTITLDVRQATNGTSNATTFTIPLPCPAKTISNMVWNGMGLTADNGTVNSVPSLLRVQSGSSAMDVYNGFSIGGIPFTTSGGKRLLQMNPMVYEY